MGLEIGAAIAAGIATSFGSGVIASAIGTAIGAAINGAIVGAVIGGLSSAIMGGDIMDGVLHGAVGGLVTGAALGLIAPSLVGMGEATGYTGLFGSEASYFNSGSFMAAKAGTDGVTNIATGISTDIPVNGLQAAPIDGMTTEASLLNQAGNAGGNVAGAVANDGMSPYQIKLLELLKPESMTDKIVAGTISSAANSGLDYLAGSGAAEDAEKQAQLTRDNSKELLAMELAARKAEFEQPYKVWEDAGKTYRSLLVDNKAYKG